MIRQQKLLVTVFTSTLLLLQSHPVLAEKLPPSQCKTSSLESALLSGLRKSEPMRRLSRDYKQALIFDSIDCKTSKNWAFLKADPHTADYKQGFETVSGVLHYSNGKWKFIEFVGDEVSSADDSKQAFSDWVKRIEKTHADCPSEIFPTN